MMAVIFSGTHNKGSGASYPVSLVGVASARFLAQQVLSVHTSTLDCHRIGTKYISAPRTNTIAKKTHKASNRFFTSCGMLSVVDGLLQRIYAAAKTATPMPVALTHWIAAA
jgi:hypothetical protein